MTVPFIQEIAPKYEFTHAEEFNSATVGRCFVVRNPEETSDFSNIKAQVVKINGDLYQVKGVDRYAHCAPWRAGEKIGLLVEDAK